MHATLKLFSTSESKDILPGCLLWNSQPYFLILPNLQICNNTNITTVTCEVHTLEAVGYSTLFLLGLGLNAAALYAFVTKRKSWKDTHVYMFNLNLADFVFVLFLPFRIYDAIFCLPKTQFCTVLMFTHFINMYASILTSTAICAHRFLAIRFPLQAKSWRKKKATAFALCLVFWGLLLTVCVIFRRENYPVNLWTCYERCKNKPLRGEFILIVIFLGFLTPLLIIVFCSSQIISILSKVNERLEEKTSTIGIVTANMVVFIVCYTPINIAFLVNFYQKVPSDWQSLKKLPAHKYLLISEWIASTNCCFDSISYYFLLTKFYSNAVNRVKLLVRSWNLSHLLSIYNIFPLVREMSSFTTCLTTINDKWVNFPCFSYQILGLFLCLKMAEIQKSSYFL